MGRDWLSVWFRFFGIGTLLVLMMLVSPGLLIGQTDSTVVDTLLITPPDSGNSLLNKKKLKKQTVGDSSSIAITADTTRKKKIRLQLGKRFKKERASFVKRNKKINIDRKQGIYSPRAAWQRSLVLPGWGQAYCDYNWKLPIVYTGYAGTGVSALLFHSEYRRFKRAYTARIDSLPSTDPTLDLYTDTGLKQFRQLNRQYRDLSIIIMAGWHALHVVEAYVGAHLKAFDVSEDLTMQVSPAFIRPPQQATTVSQIPKPGIRLSFAIK